MNWIEKAIIAFVAFEHLFFMWFEMFSWEKTGKKLFKGAMPEHMFAATKSMAANQGIYNGFLGAGLVWALFITDPIWHTNVSLFFLSCVAIAGTLGAITVSKKIFFVQAIPAILGMLLIVLKVLNNF